MSNPNNPIDAIMEEHFDQHAKEVMVDWDLEKFRESHPTLLRAIVNSLKAL